MADLTPDTNPRGGAGRDAAGALAPFAGRIRLTLLSLWAEALALAFWPLGVAVMVLYCALAFGALELLPAGAARLVALGLAGALLLALLALGLRGLARPGRALALARLDASLPGAPLSGLTDRPALGQDNPLTAALWVRHLARLRAQADFALPLPPRIRLAARDPLGLRLMASVALVAALIFAPAAPPAAIANALSAAPGPVAIADIPRVGFEAWITPPAHTGEPAVYLTDTDPGGAVLSIPVNSAVTFRFYGPGDFSVQDDTRGGTNGGNGTATLAGDSGEVTLSLVYDGLLAVREGRNVLAEWQVAVLPDLPPTIALSEPPGKSASGAMELRFVATDDYGIVSGRAIIVPDPGRVVRRHGLIPDPEVPEAIERALPMPFRADRRTVEEVLVEDLSDHPWAHLPVTLTLEVTDGAGQTTQLIVPLDALPARSFFDPLASALIEQRRDLLWSPQNDRRVEQLLRAISHRPEPGLFPGAGTYLMVRAAIRELSGLNAQGMDEATRTGFAEVLWALALRLEDGSLADAAARLRAAQDRLAEALQRGASPQEIARLMDELRDATSEYMRQRARQMIEDGQTEQAEGGGPPGLSMSQDQLREMMDRIQELSDLGQHDEARRLLEQLREFMDNMQMSLQQGGGGSEGEFIEGLQDTMRQQQDLSDEAFRQLQEQFDRQGQDGGPSAQDLADQQEALRQFLDTLNQQMDPDSPGAGALSDAERDMQGARDRLAEGDLSGALDDQARVLENLRRGVRDARGQEQRARDTEGTSDRDQRDPLGRPLGGQSDGEQTAVPDADASARARELLEEIRRRSGEMLRPEPERDYLRRLLDLF